MDFLKKQLKNLKECLKKCLDRRNQKTRSGATASSLPKCKYFDQMAFLHEKSANKPTESNLPPEVCIEASESEEFIAPLHAPCDIVSQDSMALSSTITCSKKKKSLPLKRPSVDSRDNLVARAFGIFLIFFSVKKNQKDTKCPGYEGCSRESILSQSLVHCDEMLKKSMEEEDDEDSLYCRSLIPIMRDLPKRKKRLAKIQISQLLYDLDEYLVILS